jgi:hypothetical protein
MKINHPSQAQDLYDQVGAIREGKRAQAVLLTGEECAPDNYRFTYTSGVGNQTWTTPRHRHNFEQIRYPLSGDYSMKADKVLPAGWVAYFPESAYYGPQVKNPNLIMLTLQFGGPSGRGYMSVEERRRGQQELADKGGVFEQGNYRWIDERGAHHEQDAFEATWEQAMGTRMDYPPSRYDDVIAMNPACFCWIPDRHSPGVSYKRLGSFTERDVRIALIQLKAGATLSFGTEPAAEIIYLTSGVLRHDGGTYGQMSAFGSARSEPPVPLTAAEESELFYVKMPTF